MHCISYAIFSRLSWLPSPAVGTNWPFSVDVMPLNTNWSICVDYIASQMSCLYCSSLAIPNFPSQFCPLAEWHKFTYLISTCRKSISRVAAACSYGKSQMTSHLTTGEGTNWTKPTNKKQHILASFCIADYSISLCAVIIFSLRCANLASIGGCIK